MTDQFFASFKTQEEARELFRLLSRALHPDGQSQHDWFVSMKKEYDGLPSGGLKGKAEGVKQMKAKERAHAKNHGAQKEEDPFDGDDPFGPGEEHTDMTRIHFGKHKGLTLVELVMQDYSYCQWLLKQDWFLERFDFEAGKLRDYMSWSKRR